jgi:hypothetical protein
MRQPFTDSVGRVASPRLAHLSGALEAQPTQIGDALIVTTSLVNEAGADLRLRNPFATLQFDVRGGHGQTLAVPGEAPRDLIHTAGGTRPWRAADNPLPVIEVREEGEVTSLAALDGDIILLRAHQGLSATFAIDRAAPRDESGSTAGAAFSALPEDAYTVRSIMTVIDADNPAEARILQTSPIGIHLVRQT